MFKHSITGILVITAAATLVACGNKGELFLPPDTQLALDLAPLSVQMLDNLDEINDDYVFDPQVDPQKRTDNRP